MTPYNTFKKTTNMATYTISSVEDWPSYLYNNIQKSSFADEWNTANPPKPDANPLESNLPAEEDMLSFLTSHGVDTNALKTNFKPTVFTVSDKDISFCTMISNLINIASESGADSSDQVINIPSVSNTVLGVIVEYLQELSKCSDEDIQKLKDDPMNIEVEVQKTWRNKLNPSNTDEFPAYLQSATNLTYTLFLQVLLACNTLDLKPLYELSCRVAAETFKGKSAEEISAMYNIKPSATTPVVAASAAVPAATAATAAEATESSDDEE